MTKSLSLALSYQNQLKSSDMRFAIEQAFSRSISKPNSFLTDFDRTEHLLLYQYILVGELVNIYRNARLLWNEIRKMEILSNMGKSSNLNRIIFLRSVFGKKQYEELSLTPEGSDRRYTRIRTGDFIYILSESSLEQQALFSKRLKDFSSAGLNVPQLEAQDDKHGILLLEDLGNRSLEKEVLKNPEFPKKYYLLALNQIIKLQASPSMALSVFSSGRFFDEMKWSEKYLINSFFGFKPREENQQGYLREWDKICKTLSFFPLRPAHRDYHSRNLFIKNKNIYLIDFQDAALFPRFYDPVSLLYDVYIKINNDERESLMNYFILKSGFSTLESKGASREEIRITAIQRLFKACGSFAGFYLIKKQKSHLKYIPAALKLLEKLLEEQKTCPFFLDLVKNLRRH